MLWLLLIACEPRASAPQAPSPMPLPPDEPLPERSVILTVEALSGQLTGCPGPVRQDIGDIAVFCLDPQVLTPEDAETLLTTSDAAFRLALYPVEDPSWPLWFWGADLTLYPAAEPERSMQGGNLLLGVSDAVTLERSTQGWTRIADTWLRDDLPLGTELLLVPLQQSTSGQFALRRTTLIQRLALETSEAAPSVLLNGQPLSLGPILRSDEHTVLYNPDLSLLQEGTNTIDANHPVGLSAHIGAPVQLQWRAAQPEGRWTELRYDDQHWDTGTSQQGRRAIFVPQTNRTDLQVSTSDTSVVWVNGIEILRSRGPAWGHVPPGLVQPGDNLIAVEAAPGTAVSLWRY